MAMVKPFRLRASTALVSALLLAAVLLSQSAAAADADKDKVRQLVQSVLKAWESGDAQTFAAGLHEDLVFAYPGQRLNRPQLIEVFGSYRQEKRDIKIYLWDQFFIAGDKFFTAYQFAATDRKLGKRQAVGTGVMGRIKDGKIVLLKEYFDNEVAPLQYAEKLPLDEGIVTPWPASIWLRPEMID